MRGDCMQRVTEWQAVEDDQPQSKLTCWRQCCGCLCAVTDWLSVGWNPWSAVQLDHICAAREVSCAAEANSQRMRCVEKVRWKCSNVNALPAVIV